MQCLCSGHLAKEDTVQSKCLQFDLIFSCKVNLLLCFPHAMPCSLPAEKGHVLFL